MKKLKKLTLSILILIGLASNLYSQLNDYSYKLGVQGSYASLDTYFWPDGLSYQIRPFVRFELGRYFDLGLGVGYGELNLKDISENRVTTTIIPADIRLLFSPIVSQVWNPYLTAGIGGVYWKNVTRPVNPEPNTPNASFTDLYIPVGVGTEIALSESLLLDLHAVVNVTMSEQMAGYTDPVDNYNFIGGNEAWWTLGLGVAYSGKSCSKDSDGDGITDCDEEMLGLNPLDKDTDKDGLEDGSEMNKYNTDPKKADSDGDKLKDGEEVITYATNPLLEDTDSDGLNDFDEVITFKTDPLKTDSDGDKLSDSKEINESKTNPTKSDSDNDGLSDYYELNTSKTNPLSADSDNDGLKDKSELNNYKTDPNNPDSDGDKITDGKEVNILKTNPLAKDTDNGGVDDFIETQLGKNPLDPKDDIASIDLEITFALNSAKLTSTAIKKLTEVLPKAKEILKLSDSNIEIQGHTDASGSARANKKISEKRAKSVYNWFVAHGISKTRISYKGYGESRPKYSNKTRKGRAQNRRIEMFLENSK